MIGDIKKFRFWCQKVLPLVYDNSLSYYEVLCKVVQYLNGLIDDVNKIPEYIDSKIEEALSEDALKELVESVVRDIEDVISLDNEEANTNSSKDYAIDDWLWWNGLLYKATRNIDRGTTLIVGTNLQSIELETIIKAIDTKIDTEIADRGIAISNEATARADADTALRQLIDDEIDNREDADTQIMTLINKINADNIFAYPEDYGAVGDGVADDSTAFQSAVNSGKIVYLRNKYAINDISITSPTVIIGDEDSCIYPNSVVDTILFKNVFTATANLVLKGVNIEGKGRYASTTETRYTLIDISSCDKLILKNCSIKNVGHNYVQETAPLKDYIPLWIKAIDVMDVLIDRCVFEEGGSDELMVITPWYNVAPSKPSITMKNCRFIDCTHGASMNLFAYDVMIENNTFNNFVYNGSIFNLTGENVNCVNNIFNACNVGSVFDALEACWFHAENFNVINNIFTGTCNIFAEFVGERGQIIGNVIEANTLVFSELTVFSTDNMPSMLRNTKNRSHGSLIIKNNKCKIAGGNASVIRYFTVNANATSDIPFTDYNAQDLLLICNNAFEFTNFFTTPSKYFINGTSIVSNIIIDNNVIDNPNLDNLSGSAKWVLYIDNRYVDRVIKNLTFKNNVIDDIDSSLTNGIKLYTVMDSTKPVEQVCNIGNIAYNSSLDIGTTAYNNLKELATTYPEPTTTTEP